MNLHKMLKIQKSLPPSGLHELLFARKLDGNSVNSAMATGCPCVLNDSTGENVRKYRIHGNENGVGNLVTDGEYSGKYCIPVVIKGKNIFLTITEKTTNYSYWEKQDETFNGYPVYRSDIAWFGLGDTVTLPAGNVTMSLWYRTGKNVTTKPEGIFLFGNDKNERFNPKTDGEWHRASRTLNIPQSTALHCRFETTKNVEIYIACIQIEAGSAVTGYEPYHEPVTTNIYLGKPLETDEILKYPENIIEHADGTTESVNLPKIPTFSGTTIITTDTEIPPSDIKITYKVRKNK